MPIEPDTPLTFVQLVFMPSTRYLLNDDYIYYTRTISVSNSFLHSTWDQSIIHTKLQQLLYKLADQEHDPWDKIKATRGIAADCDNMIIADLVHIQGLPFLRVGYYKIDHTPDQEYMCCEEYLPVDPKIIPQLRYLKHDIKRICR